MSTQAQKYWGRTGYVEIEGANNTFGNESGPYRLDFKFDVTKFGSFYNEFSVGILGLNHETINELTVWNPQDAVSQARQVKVYAGYESDGKPSLLLEGGIWRAFPTPPPEMWLNMDCMSWIAKKEPLDEPGMVHGTPQEIFEKVAKEVGSPPYWGIPPMKNAKPTSFMMTGTKDLQPERFAQKFNLCVYREDGVLKCIENHGERENTPTDVQDVDIDTGLLSVGNLTIAGATVRVRLNTRYTLNSWINLKSTLIPKASGLYYVIKIRHVGHLRGDEWYTELTCLRKV